ncbi:hypothetical protein [Paraburkholderia tropica]|uniref:hypothetical protein n=1 Tax=Paraburkholderia tropica TaxID=92647 RepID=UPI002AB7AD72|nr:hypothetical protein [Paraburkholderia tropica]
MNLKAIIQKIVSWFKSEAEAVEAEAGNYVAGIEQRAEAIEVLFEADVLKVENFAGLYAISAELIQQPEGSNMSTPAVAPAAPAATNTNVDSAIKIALFLKALDANLTDAAVQDATNAALAAAYPAA